MDRKKASDFPQELLNLFDLYVHGKFPGANFSPAHRSSPSEA